MILGLSRRQKAIIEIIMTNGKVAYSDDGQEMIVMDYQAVKNAMCQRFHVKKRPYSARDPKHRAVWEQSRSGKRQMIFDESFFRSLRRLIAQNMVILKIKNASSTNKRIKELAVPTGELKHVNTTSKVKP